MKFAAILLLPVFCLVSCAGYQLGGIKPQSLDGVDTISVAMFRNATLHPRAEVLASSAVCSALVRDGTYRIESRERADAVLEGTVQNVDYLTLRGTRFDSLRPEELNNMVALKWVLKDAADPTQVLASGTSLGRSQLFVAANLQTARTNALPEAMERAGESLVSQIANGY